MCESVLWQYEQLAELEWLSNYMGGGDDNFPTEDLRKLHLISGIPSPSRQLASMAAPTRAPVPQQPGKDRKSVV